MSAPACKFSPDGRHRYTLWRVWDMTNPARVLFVGLNPSTADDSQDDPTIRRCIGFARRWGFGGLCMTNIFAFRATDPAVMKSAADPVGEENDLALQNCARLCHKTVACWGTHGAHQRRDSVAWKILDANSDFGVFCLGRNADGSPKHPLYLRSDTDPKVFVL